MIGIINIEAGMYKSKSTSNLPNTSLVILNPFNYVNSFNKVLINIWLCKLGHLSNESMLVMKQHYSTFNFSRDIVCDACQS